MRFALTGGTGFVGGALAERLRRDGHHLTALVRDPARATALRRLDVRLEAGDLHDVGALDRLCGDVDGLFHVAGWYRLGHREASAATRVNVEGTRNVLDAALRNEVPRTVYTSTLAVNSDTHGQVRDESFRFTGRHISLYDGTKAEAHDVATGFADQGLPLVIVQPGVVYGPGDTARTGGLIEQVVRGERPLAPAGGGLCLGYVDDVVAGHLLAMQKGAPGRSYMLAGPRARLAEALRETARIAGTPGPVLLPATAIRATAAVSSVIGRFLPPEYAAETLRASVATYYGSPARAERELGWSARSLDEGLRRTVEALR